MPHTASPIVIGHRGASGLRPEHTEAAYRLAFALGADAVEPDIVATKDGVLVLRHENEISGTTDVARRSEFRGRRTTREIGGKALTGWFTEDFTWEELATLRAVERIPRTRPANASFDGRYPLVRLSDLLRLLDDEADAGRAAGLVAEIKHASYFESIGLPLDELYAAALADAGWSADDDRLTTESFEPSVLDRLGKRGIGGRRVFLLESSGAPADQRRVHGAAATSYAEYLGEVGLASLAGRFDGISVDKSLLGEELVARAHQHGLTVYTWTLRPENRFLTAHYRHGHDKAAYGDWPGEFTMLMRTGVDGVFADHPDLAVEARAALSH